MPNLAPNTLRSYASLWDAHVLPRLGGFPLRELTPELISRYRTDLAAAGVGEASIRKTLAILQGALERAVEWRRLPTNPARPVRKPSQERQRAVRPLPPDRVEAIRARLLSAGRLGDATLVSVLAYAGLRPAEVLALTWGTHPRPDDPRRARARGGRGEDDEDRSLSTVRLLGPLAADLAEWRMGLGRPADDRLVFAMRDGRAWTDDAWRNWRRRVFATTAASVELAGARDRKGLTQAQLAKQLNVEPRIIAAWETGRGETGRPAELPAGRIVELRQLLGLDEVRPYDLRHSAASLLLWEGMSVVEVARQLGHSPTMTLSTYAHVIDELEGGEHCSAEAEIRQAREYQTTREAVRA